MDLIFSMLENSFLNAVIVVSPGSIRRGGYILVSLPEDEEKWGGGGG